MGGPRNGHSKGEDSGTPYRDLTSRILKIHLEDTARWFNSPVLLLQTLKYPFLMD